MDLATKLAELQKRLTEHREVLLTEEAAKTALVLPFLHALGYDVFNPTEVIPEYTADVGTKKGEKVDYAICNGGKVTILVECKPCNVSLDVNHAGQLFRYFNVTDARLAVLTNGVEYRFFSDIEKPNMMDQQPFFSFSMEMLRAQDVKTLEKFGKASFDIDRIVQEAGNLKLQGLLRQALEREFAQPSDEFVALMARRVHDGRLTAAVRENFSKLLAATITGLVRDMVTERLSSALKASTPAELDEPVAAEEDEIETTEEEIAGFRIVQAIAARLVDPRRIVMRDAKSYCAVLLDDNNRKSIARLHFNSPTTRYFGTFSGKEETRHPVSDLTEIYKHADRIEARLKELEERAAA